ncbi:MAG: glycosyltransferase family 4 protein [Betaproteobacteria bacterium]|nr:glycosyltransferase family 4 protein [Betaproteobacteria bacterium]
MTPQRLLLLLGQNAFDPTSGAAQSMRQAAEVLAGAGWNVRALCTSGCEGDVEGDPAAMLRERGVVAVEQASLTPSGARVLAASRAGVLHEIVCVDPARKRYWERDAGPEYHARLDRIVREFAPQVVLAFGGDPGDERRRTVLRAAGARVVFALHNLAYLKSRPAQVDAFLAPTEFVAGRYREAWHADVQVLPTPIVPQGIVADRRDAVFTTFVNPEPAKGLWIVARLAQMLGEQRPDIPLLVVEGRMSASNLIAAGHAMDADLSRFPNLMFSPAVADVAALWATCRMVLAPSIVEEAAGRAVLEAMANGAVPLVSDRGALPETVGDAGVVLPLPGSLSLASAGPVSQEVARPWFDAITSFVDDEERYARASERARRHATRYLQDQVAPAYGAWFESVMVR